MQGKTVSEQAGPRLLSGLSSIRAVLGTAAVAELTYGKIFRDSPLNTTPAIVEMAQGQTIVVSISDSAAVTGAASQLPVVTWGSYFSWDEKSPVRPADFAAAVRSIVGDQSILVEAALPYTRYAGLAKSGPVTVGQSDVGERVHVYRKSRAEIEAQWQTTRLCDADLVAHFIGTLQHGERLNQALHAAPSAFAPLDALLREAGLAAALVSSPFTAELFTGLPEDVVRQHGIRCLYTPGRDDIVIIATCPLVRADFSPIGTSASWADALAEHLPAGVLGFEGNHLPVGDHNQIAAGHGNLTDAGPLLRRWQDKRAGSDLVYFIVAANGVLHGIKTAFDFIDRHIGGALSEREVRGAFDLGVAEFAASVGFGDRVIPSFDIIHSGERTLLPAIAGDYPLLPEHETIKFDMGLLVRDSHGCVRACSDIARTWCRDPDVRKAHDDLRAALVDHLIPSMRPGMSGADMHRLGIAALASAEPALRAAGLMPRTGGLAGYTRDCGHTLHRTTAGSVYFLPSAQGIVEPHMLGCVEYVWPLGHRILAVEDGYYVTEDNVIPFTVQGALP